MDNCTEACDCWKRHCEKKEQIICWRCEYGFTKERSDRGGLTTNNRSTRFKKPHENFQTCLARVKSPGTDLLNPAPARIDCGISCGDAFSPPIGPSEVPSRSSPCRFSASYRPPQRGISRLRLDNVFCGQLVFSEFQTPVPQSLGCLRNNPSINVIGLREARQVLSEQLPNANSELITVIDKVHTIKDAFRSLSKQIRDNRCVGAEKLL